MLAFFRRYQRFFFFFVAAIVIVSFSFFGTMSQIPGESEKEDPVIGEAIDGSPITLSEIKQMALFLSSDAEDLSGSPNFCNDGVIRRDLLETGLASLVAASYFDSLREGFGSRLERIKRYRPYVHPEAPSLSVKKIWERYLPSLAQELEATQAQERVDLSTFSHLSNLYLYQAHCPPEFLRKILLYHCQQNPTLATDPRLSYEDFSLFGFHTIADWFGHDFIDLSALFLFNGAKAAEERGYRVSLEEAKGDLLRNFEKSMKQRSGMKNRPICTFHEHLKSLGLDEKSASKVWRTVLLFRRYFHGVGSATFVDRLPYKDFASYSRESASVTLYQLPRALGCKTILDVAALQLYLESVSLDKGFDFVPTSFLPLSAIEKRAPELVQSCYRAKVGKAVKGEIGLKAPLKELRAWEVEEKNWEMLRKKCSFLSKTSTVQERIDLLDRLHRDLRMEVDRQARLCWVDLHPESIVQSLASVALEEKEFSLSKVGISLPGIDQIEKITSLLELSLSGDTEAKKILSHYSEDGETFYRIEEIHRISEPHLLTFEEAKKNQVIQRLLDRSLEAQYPKIRAKAPAVFQTKEGEWKAFALVKEEIAKQVYSDLFKAIRTPSLRFENYAKEALSQLRKNPDDSRWIQGGSDPITDQFKFEKKHTEIQRTAKEAWMVEQAFVMVPKQWSPVHCSEGDVTFFYFEQKNPSQEPILEQLAFGKETIAADAQRYLAEKLLETAKKKQAMIIPLQRENP